ncbi:MULTISPECIES: hypothetical protein [Nocardia]|uniref:Uncharacterized protein n=1 Tax=Nocardia nova TaxID=37330 RepID=A0A2T2YVE1_9NOCA|nr:MULTISPECIES: hypothetical protein [Nocardia]PSR59461.1 hypothetical protein C8259_26750 [Nocardia nova]
MGATALAVTAVALGVAGVLAFGPRHEVAAVEHATAKPGCVMFCDEHIPAAPDSHGCTMFCHEPGLPPADVQGCQLLCGLDDSKEPWQ